MNLNDQNSYVSLAEFNKFLRDTIQKINELNTANTITQQMLRDLVHALGISVIKNKDTIDFKIGAKPFGLLSHLQNSINDLKNKIGEGRKIIIP